VLAAALVLAALVVWEVAATWHDPTPEKNAAPTSAPAPSDPISVNTESIVFVRNPHWRQSTDSIRHPLLDSVSLLIDTHLDDIDRQLRTGRADARADGGVQTALQSRILTVSKLKANADDPVLAATRYMAVIPPVIPNVHCRRAIFYAWDKAAALRVFGRPTAGIPATSMTPPGIEGFDPTFQPYPSGPDQSGNLAKAKQELKLCGKPNGFTTKMVYDTPSETGPRLFAAEQRALGRVGIRITVAAIPVAGTNVTRSPTILKDEGIGLAEDSQAADYPTGYAFYAPKVPAPSTLPDDLVLEPTLDVPVVNRLLARGPRRKGSESAWKKFDQAVMSDAVYLPFIWEKALYYRNPRMTNVTCDNAIASGIYDFVNVGVK
jgi:peptide/nickel transport system substrate-binding protein